MTRIRYDEERLRLEMEGHAGAAPAGEDLVCAAASMLWLTLRENLSGERAVRELQPVFIEGDGRRCAECYPADEESEGWARAIFRVIGTGLRLLAESFPQYVSFEEAGGYTWETET